MKALVLTSMVPSPELGQRIGISHRFGLFLDAIAAQADSVRIVHIVPLEMVASTPDLDALSRQQSEEWGHPVELSLVPRRVRQETSFTHYVPGMLRADEQPPLQSFAGPEQGAAIARLLEAEAPDLVFVFCMPAMAALLRAGPDALRRVGKVYFDLNDVEHRVRVRSVLTKPVWLGKLAYLSHVPALFAAEWRGARLSARTFVCSERDRLHLARLGVPRVAVVPNAVPMPEAPPGLCAAPTLLFIGAYDYPPNAVGADRMITRILPLVRQAVPEARLVIAGKKSDHVPALAGGAVPEGVEVTGFVPDLGALYARSRVVVCPLSNGGGTRLKLIEGAAHARPMVSTTVGAEGLDLVDGRDALLRDDDAGFAAACVELLRDDAACLRLGAAARALAEARYDAPRIVAEIGTMMRA